MQSFVLLNIPINQQIASCPVNSNSQGLFLGSSKVRYSEVVCHSLPQVLCSLPKVTQASSSPSGRVGSKTPTLALHPSIQWSSLKGLGIRKTRFQFHCTSLKPSCILCQILKVLYRIVFVSNSVFIRLLKCLCTIIHFS